MQKNYQEQQNDLLSIKVADGDVDALLAIKDLGLEKRFQILKQV